jgi:hypothetical protein
MDLETDTLFLRSLYEEIAEVMDLAADRIEELEDADEADRRIRWNEACREHTCYPENGQKCPPRCQWYGPVPSWFA